LLSGWLPYHRIRDLTLVVSIMKREVMPFIEGQVTSNTELWNLLERCWGDHLRRPNIQEIREEKLVNMFP
ncbi:hypothetical protein M422DRAFT_150974, partial [Sphaerobolus stellatus SS14]